MPPIEVMDLHQKAVLWEAVGDDRYGQSTVTDIAVEINCRWVENSRQASGAEGNPVNVDATAVVDRWIPVGSVMMLGELADLPPGTSLTDADEALMEVATYSETPDLKNRNVRREVGLVFYRESLPGLG